MIIPVSKCRRNLAGCDYLSKMEIPSLSVKEMDHFRMPFDLLSMIRLHPSFVMDPVAKVLQHPQGSAEIKVRVGRSVSRRRTEIAPILSTKWFSRDDLRVVNNLSDNVQTTK